jgi:glucosamine-6-phosphate deaminase
MSSEELEKEAGENLLILNDLETLHQHFASSIAEEIKKNNKENKSTKLILPVGPVGQYPILKDLINQQGIKLKDCYFFFMDEYADHTGCEIDEKHPLSFKKEMQELFFDHINQKLNIPSNQLFFPNHNNITELKYRIENVGGIDTCYGGIGIHGHVAFNEPEPNVKNTDPRLVYLNEYTITINAIRANIGGNLANFPRKALTLGMNQILGAKRIRLYCRNDVPPLDWANSVLRLAVLGKSGDDFPVTHIRDHPDYKIITDRNTAQKPKYIL